MRGKVNRDRLQKFMRYFAKEADQPVRTYFTGGATAVLLGWRDSTIDIDLDIVPENDRLLRSLPALKEDLQLNIELASPAHFPPEAPGWEERSLFVAQEQLVTYLHYDLYAQALSKIERSFQRDTLDVEEMIRRGLIQPDRLRTIFEQIVPQLYRWPAVDPRSFRRNLDVVLKKASP